MMEKFTKFIQSKTWIVSKSYAKTAPHEYCAREYLSEEEKKEFDEACEIISKTGYKKRFYTSRMVFTYLDVGEYKYWAMPGLRDMLINRAKI